MNKSLTWRSIAATAAILGAVGCSGDLNVANPNAPDAKRAYSDPATIQAVVGGAFRTMFVAHESYDGALLLTTMGDNYVSIWNNFNIRYYTGMCSQTGAYSGQCDCPERCGWQNALTSAQYIQIERFWYAYYSALSSANDGLLAIRRDGVLIGDPANTKMVETAAQMAQGMALAEIAKNYDQGFIVTEETDLSNPQTLPLVSAKDLRDEAIKQLDEAYALAVANPFTTPSSWSGAVNGPVYTNTQLAQIIRTLEADLLAYFPRDAAANDAVDWAKVASYASQGVTTFDYGFYQDWNDFYSGIKDWGNQAGDVRVHTRVSALITSNHLSPLPLPQGNPYPVVSNDKRVGDGSWESEDDITGGKTKKQTGNGGSYIAFAGQANPRPARGGYKWSNLLHIRFANLIYPGSGLPGISGNGFVPVNTADQNRLLWAEALARTGNLALAADKVNVTRVGHGGLAPITAGAGKDAILRAIEYENELEMMGMGAAPFYNRRRGTPKDWTGTGGMTGWSAPCPTSILCLWNNAPRQYPIPAKELAVLQKELYSFGGVTNPGGQSAGVNGSAKVKSVREINAEMEASSRAEARRGRR